MIQITAAPCQMINGRIELRFVLEMNGKHYMSMEIMENDWFADESIFARVVRNASYKLRDAYLLEHKL